MQRCTWFFAFSHKGTNNQSEVLFCVFWLLSSLFFLFKFEQLCLRMTLDQMIIKMEKTFQLNIAPVNTFYRKMSLVSVHLFPASLAPSWCYQTPKTMTACIKARLGYYSCYSIVTGPKQSSNICIILCLCYVYHDKGELCIHYGG